MIYTVTMNPSLDYLLSLPALQAGETNRSAAERLVAGGKGINALQAAFPEKSFADS